MEITTKLFHPQLDSQDSPTVSQGRARVLEPAYLQKPQNKNQAYERIESVLGSAGAAGVHGAYFIYTMFWPQFRARINEMNALGWKIRSVDLPKNEWVRGIRTKYVTDAKPLEIGSGRDWYEELKGRPRSAAGSAPKTDLPLFDPELQK